MITRRTAVAAGLALGTGPGRLPAKGAPSPFVRTEGQRFLLNGVPYRFVGTNLWYGAYLGAGGTYGDRDRLKRELDLLAGLGIGNLRVLGAAELSPLKNSMKPAFRGPKPPYNEDLLKGLDVLLAEMGQRDMKAVIFLGNFWEWSGGFVTYLYWTNGGHYINLGDPAHPWPEFADFSARFYGAPKAVALYLQYVDAVVGRTNTVTGRKYRDDPAIMAWQLANEPRPGGSDAFARANLPAYYGWLSKTAKFIKARDRNHLVSTGNEGMMGSCNFADAVTNANAIPEIDYMTFHVWPLNWSWIDLKNLPGTYDEAARKAHDYVTFHCDIARRLDKPAVCEEFGFPRDDGYAVGTPTSLRDRFYDAVFDMVDEQAKAGGPFAGTNFWAWGGTGRARHDDFRLRPGDTSYVGDPPQEPQGANSVFDSDASTLEVIRHHVAALTSSRG